MDKKIESKIKKDLLARKEQIEAELKSITRAESSEKGETKAKFPELGDKTEENAMEIGEYSTNLATEQVLEKTLRDINNALKRIKDREYGVCKYCKNEINEKRLLARPVASACVKCKSKLQQAA